MPTVSTIVRKHLQAAILSCDLPEEFTREKRVGPLVELIREACDAPEPRERVSAYALAMTAYHRARMKEAEAVPLKEVAGALLAYRILAGASHRFAENFAPKIHHWVPRCYLKKWTPTGKARSGCSIPVQAATWAPDGFLQKQVNDEFFAHKPRAGKGFYELELEKFFSQVEGDFGMLDRETWALQQIEPWSSAAVFIFAAAQLARAVSPVTKGPKKLSLMVEAMIRTMDYFDEPRGTFATTEKRQVIDTGTHRRFARTPTGDVFIFAMGPHQIFAVYEGALPIEHLTEAIALTRTSKLAEARRTGGVLYGL